MNGCVMLYRAGTLGLARLGFLTDVAHWYCLCGGWRFNAMPMPRRASGNNLAEAQRAHGAHYARCLTVACCDLHGRNCEPPSELCCGSCTEAAHPGHQDGSACSNPDLSGWAL